jgi:SWI/SNF-related matrix-associated actin-dependent regulator of chromatin subfamily A3
MTWAVVPLSVISNWQMQIEEHCTSGTISSCVYYGAQRTMTAEELQEFDVIITTYQTVAGEHVDADGKTHGGAKRKRKRNSNLFDVQWKENYSLSASSGLTDARPQRIILDEGHNIRNPKTKTAKAVCALTAERRWILSGTPIVRKLSPFGVRVLCFTRSTPRGYVPCDRT